MALVVSTAWAQKSDLSYANVTPAEVEALLGKDTTIILLDVRTPAEFESETGHLRCAILIPILELDQRSAELEKFNGRTIIAYCRSGVRSAKAAGMLKAKGFRIENMTGGISQWNTENRPVVREQPVPKR